VTIFFDKKKRKIYLVQLLLCVIQEQKRPRCRKEHVNKEIDKAMRGVARFTEHPLMQEMVKREIIPNFNSNEKYCSSCFKADPLFRCSQCKETWYCNIKCQKNHWLRIHKILCKKPEKVNCFHRKTVKDENERQSTHYEWPDNHIYRCGYMYGNKNQCDLTDIICPLYQKNVNLNNVRCIKHDKM